MNKSRNRFITVIELLALAVLVAAGLNLQPLLDEYALASYHPTPSVAAIESQLNLTPTARAVLYRANPVIDDKTAFNRDCQTTKGELELGCFARNRIYILQIDNVSLRPEMVAVTAHELLHAAWARMGSKERAELGTALEQAYAGISDTELRARMADYAKSEPGEQNNELHSILGTEYAHLPPALEDHYRKYFTSRTPIVAAHQEYQGVFNTRRQELGTELATIRTLKGQLATLNRQMEQYRSSGQISTYNSLVPRQNSLVDSINSRIEIYSAGVQEYNALSRSLDSQQITDTESGVTQ